MIRIFDSKANLNRQIISLWKDCFDDSEDYISFFLNNCPGFDVVGYFVDDRLVSMYFLLDGSIDGRRCKYLYAACTDPKFRKQGIMEKLIRYGEKYCLENGYDGIFLVPANEKLYLYYEKFGFIPSFSKRKITFSMDCTDNPSDCNSTDVKLISDLKENLLNDIKGFRFSSELLEYTIKEHFYNGGQISYINTADNKTLAFYYTDKNSVFVKELLSDCELSAQNIEKLFSNKNVENIYILSPIVYNNKDIGEEYTKCGMCLPLNIEFRDYLLNNNQLYAGMYLD